MIKEINSSNKIVILHIMRSVCVCLDILLRDPCVKEKIKFYAADDFVDVLIDDKHANFIAEVLRDLDPNDALTFKVRQRLAKILPSELVAKTTELLAALQRCEQQFINDFIALMSQEDPQTQLAAEGLLQNIFEEEILSKYFNCNPSAGPQITRAHIKGRFYLEWYSLETIPCYSCYGYGGYGYGGYGYGGYGYGGYGYGGYGYGGYGYGGYGYGGYGYGGYGYGGYGYGGYGYGGYGYGGYGYDKQALPYAKDSTRQEYADLWDNQDFIWLNQVFVSGVRNAEGAVWCFKEANNRFTAQEGRAILNKLAPTTGDHDQVLFRAVAHAAISNPEIYTKIKCKQC